RAALADGCTRVRGTHQLSRAHVRRGEEDHVARRDRGALSHCARPLIRRAAAAAGRCDAAAGVGNPAADDEHLTFVVRPFPVADPMLHALAQLPAPRLCMRQRCTEWLWLPRFHAALT